MDLYQIIDTLLEERNRLVRIMQSLEIEATPGHRAGRTPHRKSPGRKSMGTSERRVVSERMSKYWAKRRQETAKLPAPESR